MRASRKGIGLTYGPIGMVALGLAGVFPDSGPMADITQLEDMAPSANLRPLHGSDVVPPAPPTTATSVWPGLAVVAASVAAAFGINKLVPALSPLVLSVLIGAVLANVRLLPAATRPGLQLAAKKMLRIGVVLLGLQLSLGDLLHLGGPGVLMVVAVVAITFFFTKWFGPKIGVSKSLSLLIATGFSICGASAVAAMEGVSDADEEEVTFAIAAVTICGSLAIVLLPIIGPLVGLHDAAFGSWAGASVHDVAQVVATASTAGAVALEAAVVVKLTRVILLAPIVAGVTMARRRQTTVDTESSAIVPDSVVAVRPAKRPPILPLFVVGFLAAIAVRSTGLMPDAWAGTAKIAETLFLASALVGLGSGVQLGKLRKIGSRPLLLALASWGVIGAVSIVGVKLIGA